MNGITELISNIFSNGFWGFIGTIVVLGCAYGLYEIIRNSLAKTQEKLLYSALLILLALGGMKLIDVGKERKNRDNDYYEYKSSGPNTNFKSSGNYSKTSSSVRIVNENGLNKGTYDVYLHQGNRYIKFQGDWINIQGKSRFSYNGNSYIIKSN
jgi:hypothetical protein